jgi:hypothetical protein
MKLRDIEVMSVKFNQRLSASTQIKASRGFNHDEGFHIFLHFHTEGHGHSYLLLATSKLVFYNP